MATSGQTGVSSWAKRVIPEAALGASGCGAGKLDLKPVIRFAPFALSNQGRSRDSSVGKTDGGGTSAKYNNSNA